LFKRVAAVSLAAAMTLGLAGCNGDSASDGDTLVIGGIGPVTGENAQYGIAVRNGLQLAADEINAAGGVNGIKLKIEFEDDVAEPEKGLTAYNALKDKNMKLLLGTVTSGSCAAVAVKAKDDNMFLLTPSGSALNCLAGDNCFRMCFTDPQQGAIAADYIADNMSAKKIAVIYNNNSDYSTGIYQGFKEEAAKKGLEIVCEETFAKDTETDFNVQIQRVSESGAELLFLPFYYNAVAMILQQAQGKLNIPVLGGDGLDGLIGLLEDSGDVSIADGVYVMSPYAASSPEPKSAAFTKAYQEKFPNDEVNQFAADAYDCVYAVKQALEQAGVNDASLSASELCDKMKSAMTSIEFDGVTGKTKWGTDGEPEKAPQVLKIVVNDGKGAYEVQ
ncbi:MAG: ABC transporter substrate-binding protein, partial [Ruminococcus sp.]|nr:ABC transporter substrate-binding protein [Ruminococcus sp.]